MRRHEAISGRFSGNGQVDIRIRQGDDEYLARLDEELARRRIAHERRRYALLLLLAFCFGMAVLLAAVLLATW